LKSTARRGRVSLTLSAIERLAKDPRPAVVIVFRLGPNGDPIRGHAIHLLNDQLALVLRRLREAQQKDMRRINRASVSFDYQASGRVFELTAAGLRSALVEVC